MDNNQNRYLQMDFLEFAILSTLMVVFFPWSLLFCVFYYGLAETKLIVLALMHDAFRTFVAVLSVVGTLLIGLLVLVMLIGLTSGN